MFEDDDDRELFLEEFGRQSKAGLVEVLAWCLMDNHAHLLVLAEINALSKAMQQALSDYARLFNLRHSRVGHLFQGRFRSEPIDSEEYLLQAVRYIHQNPEKAGIAPTQTYKWSSYAEYLGAPQLVKGLSVSTGLVFDMLGSEEEFVRFHRMEGSSDFLAPDDTRGEAAMKRAIAIAADELGEKGARNLKARPREERDAGIVRLRARGLSVRQIERLTGVSRSVVGRILSYESFQG